MHLHQDSPDALSILRDLVAIPSENPGGVEVEIAAYCQALLTRDRIDVEIRSDRKDRPNLLARIEGSTPGKVIFQGHLDTKPAIHAGTAEDAWLTDPFDPIIRDGRLYGLGACDTKGGVAAQLASVLQTAREGGNDRPTLEWQGVADEENGSLYGAAFLAEQGLLDADLAIVTEPTDGQLSFEQMGSVWSRIRISGRQAHGGVPWLGADAIAAGLDLIDNMTRAVAACRRDPDAHHPALGTRMLQGGTHAGTVSGTLEIVTDIRVLQEPDRAEILSIWAHEAARVENEFGVAIQVEPYLDGGCEPNVIFDNELRERLLRIWRDALPNQRADPHRFMGGSDARFFDAVGTPCILLGPGSLAQAHVPNEFVPLVELDRCAAYFSACAKRFRCPQLRKAGWHT